MFQSKHPAAHAHAAARAVSGAAVYVSDYPGQHDFGLLKRLVLPDGSVLRARLPGRPTADCLFSDVLRDGKSLLKVPCPSSPAEYLSKEHWQCLRRAEHRAGVCIISDSMDCGA